jgi:hypothetical protein
MVRNGKLIDREPGLEIWYGNEDLAIPYWGAEAPDPEDIPLSASTGTIWKQYSAGNVCTGCHIPGMVASYNCVEGDIGYPECTQPFQPSAMQPPVLDWTGENGYVNDGVNPENGVAGTVFSFRIKYTDVNNDAPSPIQLWIDKDDDGVYENNDGDLDLDETIDMVEIDSRDVSYWDGKMYSVTIPLAKAGDNTFIYRFHTVGGGDTVELPSGSDLTVSVSNNSPVLSWTGASYFETDGVHPNIGGLGSNYEFSVTYTDTDGDCPASIQAWIDLGGGGYDGGEQHDMLEDDPADDDCADGKLYNYSTTISSAGSYNYRFHANDGTDDATGNTGPVSDNTVTVNATANNPPSLDWLNGICVTDGVKPALGADGADYEFMVTYTDPDNTCPASDSSDIQVWIDEDGGGYGAGEKHNLTEDDSGDTDCTDGKVYKLTRQLSTVGAFDYRFYASDGTETALGEAIGNRVVTVIDAVKVRPSGGTDWFDTIQGAIDPSAYTTILVYEGTYNENILLDRATLPRDNDITLQSVCGPENTIIRASDDTEPTVHFYQVTNPVIDGFTISNGSDGVKKFQTSIIVKNCIIEGNGRGISSWHASGSFTVEDTIIRNNVSAGNGAGIYIYGGGPHSISGSIISNNESTGGQGGGIWVRLPLLTIEDTTISNNKSTVGAFMGGGGIWSRQSTLNLDKVIISSNTTGGAGGGLSLVDSSIVTMTNSNIVDNTAGGSGGGLFLGNYNSSNELTMNNCTVSNNKLTDTTNGKGGGMNNFRPSNVSINNSIFWGNKAAGIFSAHEVYAGEMGESTFSFTNSVIMNNQNNITTTGGSIEFDSSCIEADPLFVDSDNSDYHLKPISPVIDQGTATDAPADDIDGDARPQGAGYDMGADEYVP